MSAEEIRKQAEEMAREHANFHMQRPAGAPAYSPQLYASLRRRIEKSYLAGFIAGEAAGFQRGVAESLKIAEDCGRTNVENPAVDMFERMRRAGIRWCGEWIVDRLRYLSQPGVEEKRGEG